MTVFVPGTAAAVPSSMAQALTLPQWRMLTLASLGGALEFYDFIIYGVFGQYIAKAFFPVTDGIASIALSLSVFAIGYLARPAGGIVLSYFGDKYGRRKVFITSLVLVSVSTTCMGLLPTYATVGIVAPAAMVCLRLVQGFCVGGELPGSVIYAVETVPFRAGFVCGILFFIVNSGVILANVVSLTLHAMLNAQNMAIYSWRIAFLLGGALGWLSFWLRRSLEETPEFATLNELASKRPFAELMRHHWRQVSIGIGTTAVVGGFNGLIFAYMPGYLTNVVHYNAKLVSFALTVSLILNSFGTLLVGWIGDHVPRRFLLRTSAALIFAVSYPLYRALADQSDHLLLLLGMLAIVESLANGTFACILADMFPTRIRFSGVAVSFNISASIFSGTAPLLATLAIATTGNRSAPAFIMMICAAVALLASLWLRPFSGKIRSTVDESLN